MKLPDWLAAFIHHRLPRQLAGVIPHGEAVKGQWGFQNAFAGIWMLLCL